jgi:hypothetical protein
MRTKYLLCDLLSEKEQCPVTDREYRKNDSLQDQEANGLYRKSGAGSERRAGSFRPRQVFGFRLNRAYEWRTFAAITKISHATRRTSEGNRYAELQEFLNDAIQLNAPIDAWL